MKFILSLALGFSSQVFATKIDLNPIATKAIESYLQWGISQSLVYEGRLDTGARCVVRASSHSNSLDFYLGEDSLWSNEVRVFLLRSSLPPNTAGQTNVTQVQQTLNSLRIESTYIDLFTVQEVANDVLIELKNDGTVDKISLHKGKRALECGGLKALN